MPNLSIKDVPETWTQVLRLRAERNHRSLQGELMSLIEQAVRGGSSAQADTTWVQPAAMAALGGQVVGFDRLGHPITRRGTKTIEQISAEHRIRFPQPVVGGPLAVDIIRAERDAR